MKRYLLILALCGAVQAGDYDCAWGDGCQSATEHLIKMNRESDITRRLDEIKRQQEEILRTQRREAQERIEKQIRDRDQEFQRELDRIYNK